MLMAASVEAVSTRVYWKACKAISFVAFLAATEDFNLQLGALGRLVASTIVLFAKVCSCTGEKK